MTLSALGIFSAAGAGGVVAGDYELIETAIVSGSSTSIITFSNLGTYSSTYKHLQIRYVARSDRATFSQDAIRVTINGNTTNTDYAVHVLSGDGSSVISGAALGNDTATSEIARLVGSGGQTGAFNAGVCDLLDPYSTTKNKTLRTLSGQTAQSAGGFGGTFINLYSTLFMSTSSVTSLAFFPRFGTNWVAGTRFSIYGIRG
jgi:hypothetical protein